eukprot:2539588-Rhodomonas_salina.2
MSGTDLGHAATRLLLALEALIDSGICLRARYAMSVKYETCGTDQAYGGAVWWCGTDLACGGTRGG